MSRSSSIIGIGSTKCAREPEITPQTLVSSAVRQAVDDSRLDDSDIEAVFVGNALSGLISGQECVRGQVFLRDSSFAGLPVYNVENACASGSSALDLARKTVEAGAYETALVVGVEKMSHPDKTRSFAALEGALDVDEVANREEDERSRSVFMDIYAERARAHIDRYGSTPTDFATIVAKNRKHAAANPIAQFRDALSVQDVLESRMIVEPLTLPMCSPIGDAAAALVVTSADRAANADRAVKIAAVGVSSGQEGARSAVERAAARAYEEAGTGPDEVNVAEVHDATASAELEEYEHLGFAPEGEGQKLLVEGATALNGRLPVNTSGGLISRGHPVGATGVLQIVELVTQLRGEAGDRQVEPRPRRALAQNAGGFLGAPVNDVAAAVVTILAVA